MYGNNTCIPVLRGKLSIPMRVGIPVGTGDYNDLENLPTINDVEVKGDLTFDDLGFTEVTDQQILDLFK